MNRNPLERGNVNDTRRHRFAMQTPLRFAAIALFVALAPAVHAQIGLSEISRSTWIQDTGDSVRQTYTFGDSGYTFGSGLNTGFMQHSGTWALIDGGRRIRLRATRRIESRNGRQRVRNARRTFVLNIEDIGDGFIAIDGVRFTRN